MRAQWVCSRERRIALYKWSSIKINHMPAQSFCCVSVMRPMNLPISLSNWTHIWQSVIWASLIGNGFVLQFCPQFCCTVELKKNRWSRLRLRTWWFVGPQEGCRILPGNWPPRRMWHSSLRSANHHVWAWVVLSCSLCITLCLKWASLA